MSYRLQVLIPKELDDRIRKEAQRQRISKGAWVRRAIEESLQGPQQSRRKSSAVDRLARLSAPTADIDQMIAETQHGRWWEPENENIP